MHSSEPRRVKRKRHENAGEPATTVNADRVRAQTQQDPARAPSQLVVALSQLSVRLSPLALSQLSQSACGWPQKSGRGHLYLCILTLTTCKLPPRKALQRLPCCSCTAAHDPWASGVPS